MAFDIEAAKADGYTDEEIRQYLETKDQPLPADQPRDRSEEQVGTAVAAIPAAGQVAKDVGMLGAELYAGKKLIFDPLMNRFGGGAAPATAPVAPATPAQQTFNALKATDAQNAARASQQPGIVQRGMDYARQMQKVAANRVMQAAPAAAPYAVPAAVGLGGAAATGLAAGQMSNMTPEQRKKFYDNPMLGAMGGDAALGAAIMNRGQ